jgi:aldehyde dehydrogenase (NAD+)
MAGMVTSTNPFDPSDVVAETEVSPDSAVDAALGAAVAAQSQWAGDAMLRSRSLGALADAVAARADEFTALMVREVGKPVTEAEGEVARAVAILRFYSQVALDPDGETLPGSTPGARVVVRREPLGVVLAICPWNFPLAIPLWKAAPALAYGNTVLLKPAGPAIATAALLLECVAGALPEAVMSGLVLPGSRAAELLDDERIAAVTFTGSTGTGISVAERMARRAAPAQAEMGGQNPAVVLEDADVESAAAAIVGGAMGYAGQKCTATRRVIALAGVADRLEHRIAELVTGLEVGDPRQDGVTVGPLISADAVEEFEQAVASALGSGATETARARLDAGAPGNGSHGGPSPEGHFVSPALLRQDDPHATVNQEETFGPLLTFLRVEDEAAAVAAANATRFGLVGAVHGRDLGRAQEVAAQIDCGLRRINAPTPGVDYYAPFGGEGRSSFGPREQGRAAREFFTSSTTTTILPAP